MTIKHLRLLASILFIPFLSWGQLAYFATDSITSVGARLIDGGPIINARVCQVIDGNIRYEYSPFEVKEYGFKDGRVYVSKEIRLADSVKTVFLERLQEGDLSLYYYQNETLTTYFVEVDNTLLLELPKHSATYQHYKEQLAATTANCEKIAEMAQFVPYRKAALTRYFAQYNRCDSRPFPHLRYGVTLGYNLAKLTPLSNSQFSAYDYFVFDYDGAVTFGIFIDKPLFVSHFSFHPELFFSKHGYSFNQTIGNKDFDFVANLTALKIPLLFRYTLPTVTVRPFLNIGFSGSYLVQNETAVYETSYLGNSLLINKEDTKRMGDVQVGLCAGGGFEYRLSPKRSLFFEVRYHDNYSVADKITEQISGFMFTAGINL